VVVALTRALDSRSDVTRSCAAQALARFGHRAAGALPRLRTLAEGDGLSSVRAAASAAIVAIEADGDDPETD
jgi:hypothetical protein